jgi:REP element-mobilizing transposase RayT
MTVRPYQPVARLNNMADIHRDHHRRSIRLRGYDYSQAGAYFITIVTQDRTCLLGDVVDGQMRLNEFGEIVREEWLRTAQMRSNVALDAFVIMPNHLHGIIILRDRTSPDGGGTWQPAPTFRRAPTVERFGKPTSNSIPTIVRLFKSATTKRINIARRMPTIAVWQRNYYEHIIRNESALGRIREYIETNPLQWAVDRENPRGHSRSAAEQWEV